VPNVVVVLFGLKAAISRGKPHPQLVWVFSASSYDGVETQNPPQDSSRRSGFFGWDGMGQGD